MTNETTTEECGKCGGQFPTLAEVFSHSCTGTASKFVTRPSNFGTGTTTLPAPGSIRMPSTGRSAGRAREDVRPATERQIKWLRKLAAELHPGTEALVEQVIAAGFDRTSKALDKLFAENKARLAAEAAPVAAPAQEERRHEAPKSKPNQYAGKCGNCNKRVAPLEGVRELIVETDKWVVWHREGECPSSDLFPFPDGRYAVNNEEGVLRFYVCRDGKVFVMASDELHRINGNAAKAVIAKIAVDPEAASRTFGRELEKCGRCGRTLTDESSRREGIGPICATKGW